MSMLRYVTKTPKKVSVGLPNPVNTPEKADLVESLNDIVDQEYVNKTPDSSKKRKRGEYSHYTPEQKAKIARYAIDNGATKAAKYYSDKLGITLNESSVRTFKKAYLLQQNTQKTVEPLVRLESKKRGRPKILGDELDKLTSDYIKDLRESGGVVNTNIVQSIGRGVVINRDKFLLAENGGSINLSREWARSLLDRLNFKKRKATKGVKHLPGDFETIRAEFLKRVKSIMEDHDIPPELVINWDQTGLNMIPVSAWTMEEKGSKQVKVIGMDDKRQITALLACTLSGKLLPPQLIYAGKTDACHPKVDFPSTWNITHTDSHWSTEESMDTYVDKIILPYVENIRDNLPVSKSNQKALAIFDVFKAHRSEKMLATLKTHGIRVVFVPPSCTDKLQPLDQTVNKRYKEELKGEFQKWYADRVSEQINRKGTDKATISEINLKTSVLKPLHAKWLIKCHNNIAKESALLANSFTAVGISPVEASK